MFISECCQLQTLSLTFDLNSNIKMLIYWLKRKQTEAEINNEITKLSYFNDLFKYKNKNFNVSMCDSVLIKEKVIKINIYFILSRK